MTKEDIIRMAREAGITDAREYGEAIPDECLERFAQLVAAAATEAANARANASWTLMCEKMVVAEREACAKVCDNLHWDWHMGDDSGPKECAKEIRERGNK